MSTVALVPQPPELAGAGSATAAPRQRARRSGTTPTDVTAIGTTPTNATTTRTTTAGATPTNRAMTGGSLTGTTLTGTTTAGTKLTGAATGRMPVRSCAGGELGWQPVADRPPVRLTRRGRALVAALTVLVFGAAVLVLGLRAAGALTDGPRFSETTSVQVGAGQTLWSIAAETNPDQDPRVVIDEIVKLNGLRNAGDVTPGQTLVVPKP